MKNYFVLLAGAAALSLASCSQETPVETTTTTDMPATDMAAADMSADASAQRVADRMATDMSITDEAMKTRMRDAYASRNRRMSEMRTRYATDTMGMAAAMRESDMQMDNDYKTIFTDPKQYESYQTNRSTYYTMGNEDVSGATSSNENMSARDKGEGMMGSDVQTKVKSDGDIKMKDAEGNKLKMDADDGTVKYKPEEGDKVKVE